MKNFIPKLLFLAGCITCIMACGTHYSAEVINPTDEDIIVTIDDKVVNIGKNALEIVSLSSGEHTLVLEDQDIITLEIKGGPEVIINPTKSRFLQERVHYFTSDELQHDMGSDTIVVGGYELVGDYKDLGSDLVIEGRWDYGPKDKLDMEIHTLDTGKGGSTTRTKVYTERDYVRLVEKEYKDLLLEYEKEGLDKDMLQGLLGLTDEQMTRIMK